MPEWLDLEALQRLDLDENFSDVGSHCDGPVHSDLDGCLVEPDLDEDASELNEPNLTSDSGTEVANDDNPDDLHIGVEVGGDDDNGQSGWLPFCVAAPEPDTFMPCAVTVAGTQHIADNSNKDVHMEMSHFDIFIHS